MKTMPKSLFTAVSAFACVLALSTDASALSAVIEVNAPSWLETRAPYPAALTRYYAPHPVFFEGWKSEPREEIASYDWDFGDGSAHFSGFNAAHVYETPGTYTVTLKVTRKAAVGETPDTDTDTIEITVLERDGKTYYVDSAIGNDTYDGKSQTVAGGGAGPWKTATHAFRQMCSGFYGQGDRILFKRGQTFDLEANVVTWSHWATGDGGFMFGAYGTGHKPIIQTVGAGGGSLFTSAGVGARFISFVDLEFNCTAEGQERSIFWNKGSGVATLLWLRVDLKNFYQGWILTAGYEGTGEGSGIFVVDCTTYDSRIVHFYCISSRVALLNNHFDYSQNHLAYAENVRVGVIDGNTFERAAFGRCALRISGAGLNYMASNVWVSNNDFLGWMDPRKRADYDGNVALSINGDRYNYTLVGFTPNVPTEDRFGEWLVFENNVVTDSEVFMRLAAWEHVLIRKNVFTTPDPTQEKKFYIGEMQERRPLYDVQIVDNTFEYRGTLSPGLRAPMLYLRAYSGPAYPYRNAHEDIAISRNLFKTSDTDLCFLMVPDAAENYACLTSCDNLLYFADASLAAFARETSPVTYYTLSQWRSLTGNDQATQIYTNTNWPVPGWAKSPETDVDSPIPVIYERAQATSGGALSEVRLWARLNDGPWADTGLRTSGASGSFSFPATQGVGTYYFATQAVDTQGNASLAPVGPGSTKTYYTGGAPADTTAPDPGVVSAPASATASPIPVTYTGAADESGGSGLKEVELWVKKASVGTWGATGLKGSGASGSFSYPVTVSGAETFYFSTRAKDNVGNISALPSDNGQASTVFDNTTPPEPETDTVAPTTGSLSVPSVTAASPITISYLGVADEGGSGLKQVVLWTKINGGSWLSTGMTNAQSAGSFAYTPAAGDGSYAFALRAEDNAGNFSAVPSGAGTPCLFDKTPPVVGSMNSPQYTKTTPIPVEFGGISDGAGSGLKKVYLWFRKDGGSWTDSGLSLVAASGAFSPGASQNGTYEYALRVEDTAGNISPVPGGAGQTATVFDTVAPALGTVSAPGTENAPPISVVYSGVQDAGSGLKAVYLWFRKGAGTWQNSGLSSAGESGSFSFNGMTGNDTYYFAVQADDNAGNLTPVPSGNGGANTVYSAQFSPGTAASPQYATSAPIIVTYSGAVAAEIGIKSVRLWCKYGSDGEWVNTGLTSPGESGQFEFSPVSGDGTYHFATTAENNDGGLTPEPPYGDGDTQTIYDTTPPYPGNMTSPQYTTQTPVVVNYSGANDASSGLKEVRLWFKKGYAGAWQDTGQTSTTPDGSFTFEITGEDAYFFFLQAEDNAGLVSAEPSDALVFGGG